MSFARLDLCDGPMCPMCGCKDARILEEPTEGSWWPSGKAACKHCGRRFAFRLKQSGESAGDQATAPLSVSEPEIGLAGNDGESIEPFDPDRPVPYETTRCPFCGSRDTKITSTRRPRRFHKCRGCGESFQSVEADG